MTMLMNRLRYMSLFATIVECGSITAAAVTLELSKSVVSHHLKALERELGVVLLKRTTRQQTLTAAGAKFYQQCQQATQLAEVAWQEVKSALETPQGRVKITAPHALMVVLIAPAIAQVMKEYPLLEPELVCSDVPLDLMIHDIDLAIRVGQSPACSLKQRRMGEFRDVLCGEKTLINQGVDQQTPYVANHWQSQQITHQLTHKTTGEVFEFTPNIKGKSDSFHTCLALIQAGAGVGLVPDFLYEKLKASLLPAFPDFHLPSNPIYVLHPFNEGLPLASFVCLEAIEQKLQSDVLST